MCTQWDCVGSRRFSLQSWTHIANVIFDKLTYYYSLIFHKILLLFAASLGLFSYVHLHWPEWLLECKFGCNSDKRPKVLPTILAHLIYSVAQILIDIVQVLLYTISVWYLSPRTFNLFGCVVCAAHAIRHIYLAVSFISLLNVVILCRFNDL